MPGIAGFCRLDIPAAFVQRGSTGSTASINFMTSLLIVARSIEKQISNIIHSLTEGSPVDQKTALETYFLPDSGFIHPLCRVPSFKSYTIPLIGEINSRWVIWMVYRWYKILSPRIVLNVECEGIAPQPLSCSSFKPIANTTFLCRIQSKVPNPLRRYPPTFLPFLHPLL